jgi:hypothetical protein
MVSVITISHPLRIDERSVCVSCLEKTTFIKVYSGTLHWFSVTTRGSAEVHTKIIISSFAGFTR